jgi:hypothetical protein
MHLSPKLCFERQAAVVAVAEKFNFQDRGVPKFNLGMRRTGNDEEGGLESGVL